jgi:hypothetical protein
MGMESVLFHVKRLATRCRSAHSSFAFLPFHVAQTLVERCAELTFQIEE